MAHGTAAIRHGTETVNMADKIKFHRNKTKSANHVRKQSKDVNDTTVIKPKEDELR
jgi:glutathione synthase/RimK-type ligase-like ATP-grasp enzyme